MHRNFVHMDYTRFIQPLGEIKGLSLNDALLQLDWNKRNVAAKVHEALEEFIVRSKEEGFDLNKTYIGMSN